LKDVNCYVLGMCTSYRADFPDAMQHQSTHSWPWCRVVIHCPTREVLGWRTTVERLPKQSICLSSNFQTPSPESDKSCRLSLAPARPIVGFLEVHMVTLYGNSWGCSRGAGHGVNRDGEDGLGHRAARQRRDNQKARNQRGVQAPHDEQIRAEYLVLKST
jgi:hypothetical protein